MKLSVSTRCWSSKRAWPLPVILRLLGLLMRSSRFGLNPRFLLSFHDPAHPCPSPTQCTDVEPALQEVTRAPYQPPSTISSRLLRSRGARSEERRVGKECGS